MNPFLAFALWFVTVTLALVLWMLRIYGHEPCSAQPEKFSTRWRRPKPPASGHGAAPRKRSPPTAVTFVAGGMWGRTAGSRSQQRPSETTTN